MQASTLDFHGNMGSPVTEFPHRCPVHRAVGAPSNAKKPGGIAASSLWLQGMEKPAIKMEIVLGRFINQMLHGAGICTPTFARTKSPSFVGKYTSTMEHLGYWVN